MGLPVAALSDNEKTPPAAASSVSNNNNNTAETTIVVEHPGAMDPDTTSLVEPERMTDANVVKIDDEKTREEDDDPSTATGLGDLDDDATFITAVPVIQNLADVVEVMSVVANDSEPQLQPPAPPTDVNEEPGEGGEEKNEAADVKNTDDHHQAGPDIDQYFLSGGDEKDEENGENEPEGADYEVVEAHQALPISERRKQKRLEVFVGGLDKETTEEDLSSVFKKVGDVLEVRLMKNPQTGKNKGYAFIRYATAALAKKAARELERVDIRGRSCGVLPSEENDTLFLGNISRSWKKEQVLDALKSFGIESVEDITLMEDPQIEGGNRGFAFIEFNTHKEALSAFRRLQQNDAIFGTDRSAKVSWAQPLNEPDEDTMSQVKSVFVDGMPPSWDEEKVKEHFGTYGTIERIVLARNMLSAKRKDFGFVNYVERDGALLCIEALNNTEISDGDLKMKVKVMLAKPQSKNKSAKGGTRGGYQSQGFRGDNRMGPGVGPGIGSGMGPVLGPGLGSGAGPGLGNLGMGMSMGMGMGMGMGLRGGLGLLPYDVLSTGWGNMGGNMGSTIGANIPRFENQLRFGNMRDRGFGMSNMQRPDAKKAKKTGKRNISTTNDNNNNNNNNNSNNNNNNNNNNNRNKYNDHNDDSTEPALKEENAGRNEQKSVDLPSESATKESPQNGDVSSAAGAPPIPSESNSGLQPAAAEPGVSKPSLDKFECSMCGFGSDSADEYETHKNTKVHKLIEGLRKDQKLNNKTPLSLLHEYASRHHCEVHYETEAETNGPFEVTAVIGASGAGSGTTSAPGAPTKGFGVGRNKARAKQMAAASALEKILEKVSESELTKPSQSRQRFDRPNRKSKGSGSSAPASGNRNPRDWRGGMNNSSSNSSNKNKRSTFPASDLSFLSSSRGGGAYLGNPNAIPLNGYADFVSAGGRSSFGDRFGGRGGAGGATFSAGGAPFSAGGGLGARETYAERYDRIQSGRGYGVVSPGFGAGAGGGGSAGGSGFGSAGGGGFGGRDLAESTFANRELPPPPPLPSFNGRDMPALGFVGGNRDYEPSPGIKRQFVPMDEETRFVEAQRAHPRQCLESHEQVSMHSNTNAQGFGVQQMFPEAQRSCGPRPQEQSQFNAYVQPQHQGLSISHNIVQSSHIPNQHPNMSIAMVGVPTLTGTQGGTPYSIYDAASQPNTPLSTSGYTNMNQDYMVNTPSIPEMPQGNSYPTQSTYGVPYGMMQQSIPSQVVGNFAPMQNCIQQQSFY